MIETYKGMKLIADDSHFGVWIRQCGKLGHNESVLNIVIPLIPIGGTVIDAGCFIGDMTEPFCTRVSNSGTVWAFDANPEAIECCKHNCPTAVCMNVALGDSVGTGTLRHPSDNNFGSMQVDLKTPGDIEIIRIDDLEIPHVSFVKIDVDGCEVHAIKGALKTLERSGWPPMLCEVQESCLNAHSTSGAELLQLLHDLGYKTRNVFKNQAMEGPQYDVLCMRDRPFSLT